MKLLLTASLLLFSFFSFAAKPKYTLKLEMNVDGQKVASNILKLQDKEIAEINQDLKNGKAHVVLSADEIVENSTRLNFQVYLEEKGVKKLISTPQMIVMLGKEAKMTINETKEDALFHELSLKVVAEKND